VYTSSMRRFLRQKYRAHVQRIAGFTPHCNLLARAVESIDLPSRVETAGTESFTSFDPLAALLSCTSTRSPRAGNDVPAYLLLIAVVLLVSMVKIGALQLLPYITRPLLRQMMKTQSREWCRWLDECVHYGRREDVQPEGTRENGSPARWEGSEERTRSTGKRLPPSLTLSHPLTHRTHQVTPDHVRLEMASLAATPSGNGDVSESQVVQSCAILLEPLEFLYLAVDMVET